MKRRDLVRHLESHGRRLLREGASHSIYTNPAEGMREAVPRHSEIKRHLARSICRVRVAATTVGGEAREAVIGKINGVTHTVIVTYRGDVCRIISARPSSKNETAIYEASKKP